MDRFFVSTLVLLFMLTSLGRSAVADVIPMAPTLTFRGVAGAITTSGYPDEATFEVDNRGRTEVVIRALRIAVWDGSTNHPASLRGVHINGRRIRGPLTVPAGTTLRVTVQVEVPDSLRRANRWQFVLSGESPVPFETLPAIVTRVHRDPVAR